MRASLLDKDVMLRAERLQAMADPVILLSIRSYHCHESGCYAKGVFDGYPGSWAHVEDDHCVYNTASMAERFGNRLI